MESAATYTWQIRRNEEGNPRRNNLHGLYYISAKGEQAKYLWKSRYVGSSAFNQNIWPYDKKIVVEAKDSTYFTTYEDAKAFLDECGYTYLP